MLGGYAETLKNRPYFGGFENKRQVRGLNEIKPYINFIEFNVYVGMFSLIHVLTYPFMVNSDWCIYYEELGSFNRRSCSKRLNLSKYSVIPYDNGKWERDGCLLKISRTNAKKLRVKTEKYQPQYYNH